MRSVALLCFLALFTAPLSASPPCGQGYRKGEACPPAGAIQFRGDAALTKLWAIWSVTTPGTPDSTVVIVRATGKTDTRRMYLAASKTDSLDVGYPAPGVTRTVTALAVAFKFGKSSDTVTIGTGTVQGDVPTPTGTLKLIPAGWVNQSDSTGVCAAWQASHPGQSPWFVVNTEAVPACQTIYGPKIFQVCTVYVPTVGAVQLCKPLNPLGCNLPGAGWTPDVATYCQNRYDAFRLATG